MKRIKMTIEQIRNDYRYLYGAEVDKMGIMALVEVENMGWCKDGTTRWYHFTNDDGQPAVYFKY